MTDNQRRHFTRIPFDADYRLINTVTDQHWSGSVIDLSLKGALIKRPATLNAKRGDQFTLDLLLGNEDATIEMQVKVAHIHDDFIGFECHHIDLESMSHLRRVFELNLGDSALLEREINEMLKLSQQ